MAIVDDAHLVPELDMLYVLHEIRPCRLVLLGDENAETAINRDHYTIQSPKLTRELQADRSLYQRMLSRESGVFKLSK